MSKDKGDKNMKKKKFEELKDYIVELPPVFAGEEKGDEYKVKVLKAHYMDNSSVALVLFESDTGEEFDTITVNIDGGIADEKRAYIDTNNCSWAEKFLQKNKLGKNLGICGFSGFCCYPLYEIAVDEIADYDEIEWGAMEI